MPKPDWEAFGRDVMTSWPDGGLDGLDLQEAAIRHCLIVPAPGGFDPSKHGDEDEYGTRPGDPWFERNYKPKP